jgi:hypothetical protein
VPILDEALALDPGNQLALDYKIAIQEKIEKQNTAMESSASPHELAQPQHMESLSTEK